MSLFAQQSREELRAAWRSAWQRHAQHLPLEPLQTQMVDVIAIHPEYHALVLIQHSGATGNDPAANPFLHLGLHLALREQLGTDRPRGLRAVHQRLQAGGVTAHLAEHRMMEVLAETLWQAQSTGRTPDERHYLAALQRL